MTFRYFPYEGNPYHELTVMPGCEAGSVRLVISKDRGNRQEWITIQPGDIGTICEEIRKAAGEGDAR